MSTCEEIFESFDPADCESIFAVAVLHDVIEDVADLSDRLLTAVRGKASHGVHDPQTFRFFPGQQSCLPLRACMSYGATDRCATSRPLCYHEHMEINDPVNYSQIARRVVRFRLAESMSRQRVMQLHRGDKRHPRDPNFPPVRLYAGPMKLFEWEEVRKYFEERDTTSGRRKGWRDV